MLFRNIPSTNELLPVIGVGSWQQFDVGAQSKERDNLKQVLRVMNEHEASLIDSSPMYARAEQVIGDLTQEIGLSSKFFYATKVWTSGKTAGIRQMQESMQKMKRPVMDLMQVHNLLDWSTHLDTIRQWKSEGRIRYSGITHYTVSYHTELERIIQTTPIDFVQFNYSIASRQAERKLLPAARDNGVAVIINEPLEKGYLFNKVRRKSLPAWAAEYNINSWGQFFLKYIISHPAVTCIIPGTSDPSHMLENLSSAENEMPDEKARGKMASFFDSL